MFIVNIIYSFQLNFLHYSSFLFFSPVLQKKKAKINVKSLTEKNRPIFFQLYFFLSLINLSKIEFYITFYFYVLAKLFTSSSEDSLVGTSISFCLSRFLSACRMSVRRNCERAATMAICAGILVSSSPTMNSTSQKRLKFSSLPKSSCNVHLG